MSPLDELFLVLLALYLYESTWCVPAAATLFGGGATLRRVRAELFAGVDRTFAVAPLLRPFMPQLATLPWSFAFALDGVVAYSGATTGRALPTARAARFIAFASAPTFRADGATVSAEGQPIAVVDSAGAAERLAQRLAGLVPLDRDARAAAIERWIAERLDVAAARARWESLVGAIRPLQAAVTVLGVWLALVAPIAAWRVGLAGTWPWLLAGLAAALTSVIFLFLRAARRLDGDWNARRIGQAVAMVVYPVGAIRAVDLLARRLLDEFDPVAVALAAGDAATRDELAELALRESRWPLNFASRAADVAAAERWTRERWRRELLRRVGDCAIHEAKVCVAPAQSGAGAVAWCPRCRALYGPQREVCVDCEGVRLEKFARPES